jgi:Family of unknown function (DUF6084)
MVDLDFAVEGAEIARHAAAPLLLFKLRLTNTTPGTPVQNVMLQCQIRIEPTHRHYAPSEQEPLSELFGTPNRWGTTLHSLLWTYANVLVPPFETGCTFNFPVPCSYDFNIAATKYFYGLEDGEVPLALLFSGTIFYRDGDGRLQIVQIAHDKEASYRLPVRVWQSMMDHYYPASAWLRLNRDAFDEFYRYKRQNGFASWEDALRSLLPDHRAEARQ